MARAVTDRFHLHWPHTDRPRRWTLYDPGADEPIHANGPAFYGLDERDGIHALEWDREKVVPIIADVLGTYGSQREAEAIFDALDREE